MSCKQLLLLLVACAALTGFRAPLDGAYQGLGTQPPDATLVDLDGNRQTLSEASPGWTLLKFGTTWCRRCGDEVKELNTLSSFLQAEGVGVVEVFIQEGPETVREDLIDTPREYAHRVLLDPLGRTMALYSLRLIPRVFLVNPEGVVRLDAWYLQAPELKARIAETLAKR